jgi:hypothetical protein
MMQGTVNRRPKKKDLMQYESGGEEPISNEMIKNCEISTYFIRKALIDVLPETEQIKHTKKERLEKWFRMVCYDLDTDVAHKTIA